MMLLHSGFPSSRQRVYRYAGKRARRRERTRPQGWIAGVLLAFLLLVPGKGNTGEDPGASSSGPGSDSMKRARRLEFDERLIMGQSLKSGAIYLFERKDSEIQSMVEVRKDFRKELLAPLEPTP